MSRPVDWALLAALIISIFVVSLAFYPALRLPSWARAIVLTIELGLLAGAPLLISSERPFLRFLAAVYSVVCGTIIQPHGVGR